MNYEYDVMYIYMYGNIYVVAFTLQYTRVACPCWTKNESRTLATTCTSIHNAHNAFETRWEVKVGVF